MAAFFTEVLLGNLHDKESPTTWLLLAEMTMCRQEAFLTPRTHWLVSPGGLLQNTHTHAEGPGVIAISDELLEEPQMLFS